MRSFSVTSANITINDVSLETRFFVLHFRRRLYGSFFDHFDVIGPQSYRIRRKKTQDNGHHTVHGHLRSFKVTVFGTNRKPICDFPIVINSNLHPISHHFEVIADYWSNLHFRQRGTPIWHIRSGWTPDLRTMKFSLKKLETSLYITVLIYLQRIISFCHNARVWRSDGRTDSCR